MVACVSSPAPVVDSVASAHTVISFQGYHRMSLGDISFILAFVAFPLLIVILSIWGLRTLNRRERQPLARFSSNNPAESTQELPIAQLEPKRDWAAVIQPMRGQTTDEPKPRTTEQSHSFAMPTYRGRSGGVVRRVNGNPRRRKPRSPINDPSVSAEDQRPAGSSPNVVDGRKSAQW